MMNNDEFIKAIELVLDSDDLDIKLDIAKAGLLHDRLSKDKHFMVRQYCVRYGYDPNLMRHDEHPMVRLECIAQGLIDEQMCYDEDFRIRMHMAKLGYKPEMFAHDRYLRVRNYGLHHMKLKRKGEYVEPPALT